MLEILKLSPDAVCPNRAHPDDAGLDLYGIEEIILSPGQGKVARTGIAIALAGGYVGLVSDRSSLAKKGIKTAGGVIDAGYRGELQIVLWNLSGETVRLCAGERIAQLLIMPIVTPQAYEVSSFEAATERGDRGFGSSGK
ncbi:dUTP diphosphatase [Bdellovibrionota bacterium FG-1]